MLLFTHLFKQKIQNLSLGKGQPGKHVQSHKLACLSKAGSQGLYDAFSPRNGFTHAASEPCDARNCQGVCARARIIQDAWQGVGTVLQRRVPARNQTRQRPTRWSEDPPRTWAEAKFSVRVWKGHSHLSKRLPGDRPVPLRPRGPAQGLARGAHGDRLPGDRPVPLHPQGPAQGLWPGMPERHREAAQARRATERKHSTMLPRTGRGT